MNVRVFRRMGRLLIVVAVIGAFLVATAVSAKSIKAEKPVRRGGYRFSETFLAGGPGAPEEAQFFERLGPVAVDADAKGNLYVLDNGNYRVQVFSPAGKFLRSLGAEGEGPGEFKLPMFMAVNASGMVAVQDIGTRRVTVFNPDGKVRNDQILGDRVQGLLLRDDGTLIVAYDTDSPVAQEAFDASGKSIWKLKIREEKAGRQERVVKVGPGLVAPAVASGQAGTVFGVMAETYSVGQVSPAGQLLMDFTRSYERQKARPPKLDGNGENPRMIMVKETSDAGPGGGGGGGGDGAPVKREVTIGDGKDGGVNWEDLAKYMPEFTSDLRGLVSWPDGRIWAVTSKEDGGMMVSDEWDASGTYQRVFSIPEKYRWLRVGADGNLYAVAHDEEDYPMVYRLDVAPVD